MHDFRKVAAQLTEQFDLVPVDAPPCLIYKQAAQSTRAIC
jgi:hypothetical protein